MPAEKISFVFPATDAGETSRSLKALEVCKNLLSEKRRLLLVAPMRHAGADALLYTEGEADKCLSLHVVAWTDNSAATEGWEFTPRIHFWAGERIISFDFSNQC